MQIYSENSFNNVSFMSAESALTAVYYSSVYTHSQVWRTRLKHANRRLTRGSIGVLFRQEGLSISPLLVTRYTAPCTFQMKNRDGDVPRDYAYQEPPIDHQLSGWQCMSSICLWRTDGFRRQMMDKTRQMGINVEWSICEASKEKIKLFQVDESHLIRSVREILFNLSQSVKSKLLKDGLFFGEFVSISPLWFELKITVLPFYNCSRSVRWVSFIPRKSWFLNSRKHSIEHSYTSLTLSIPKSLCRNLRNSYTLSIT